MNEPVSATNVQDTGTLPVSGLRAEYFAEAMRFYGSEKVESLSNETDGFVDLITVAIFDIIKIKHGCAYACLM